MGTAVLNQLLPQQLRCLFHFAVYVYTVKQTSQEKMYTSRVQQEVPYFSYRLAQLHSMQILPQRSAAEKQI
jgi:hypothetical protein